MGLKINVGCGATPTTGWENFDNSPSILLAPLAGSGLLPANQRRLAETARSAGVRYATAKRLPVADGSASVVYSSHMLEHLDRFEAAAFLDEARRALEPNGVIRLALPDLRRKAEQYVADGDADQFVRSILMGTDRARTPIEWFRHMTVGPRHHLWMYDAQSLVKLLRSKGFRDAVILEPGQTTIPEPGPLNLREREEESFYVEARR